MRYSKKYIFFTVILILAFAIKLNPWSDEYAEVDTFRGAQLEDEVFYPLIAKNINEEGLLTVTIGEQQYTNKTEDIIVNEGMQPMLSISFIREVFDCSARVYDDKKLTIERGEDTYTFQQDQTQATENGMPMELVAPFMERDGQYYVALEDLCNFFGYEFQWDAVNHVATATESEMTTTVRLPDSYDLRDKGRVSAIKNQGTSATCWAYAALGALESAMLPEEEKSFDIGHMTTKNSFQLDTSAGGDYTMAVAYLLAWQGPVQEKSDKIDKHVQEVHFYNEDDIDDIKWAVYQYGGVSTSIYANVSTSNLSSSSYYNKSTNSYCYTGSNKPNHDVVIIGWDDNYSKSKFASSVPGDGAFICQNSWGSGFGEKGVFYVSYYDTNVGMQCVSYQGVESANNYDGIYQSDLCGWVGQLGYNKESMTAANVYRAEGDERIEAAGFYALDKNTEYQIYFVSDYQNTASLANRKLVAEGVVDDAGYYTIPFDAGHSVMEGEQFAIVLAIKTPGAVHPMAIEYQAGNMTDHVDVSDGEGYISNNGLDWESVEEKASGNLCLKAYSTKQQSERK